MRAEAAENPSFFRQKEYVKEHACSSAITQQLLADVASFHQLHGGDILS
jgi:hypothetical protein